MDNKDTRTRTVKEWAELHGLNPDSVRKAITRKTGQAHGVLSVLTVDEWEMWRPGKPGNVPEKSGKNPGNVRVQKRASVLPTSPAAQNDVSPDIKPEQEAELPALETLRDWVVDTLLIALCVGHAGLIWYELAATYGQFGFIGGGVIFGFIVAAVLLAADRSKNETSTYALIFALVIDLTAIRLHYDSFKDFGAPNDITIAVCAFLGGMSWGALFLFRHKKNN